MTSFNYFCGLVIGKTEDLNYKKIWLSTGLLINLGSLLFFKYVNFFAQGLSDLVAMFGISLGHTTFDIILPIGISFYTFISLSYLIDIYYNRMPYERSLINVLLSLSFFPIILAGPIHRPQGLIPQIKRNREFDYNQATDGLRQILWGLFSKIVIADNIGEKADLIFSANYTAYSGSTLLLGAFFYAIQIYADFAGYSNIAIGIGRLFGFDLMRNFAFPYFAKDIIEFWKRWNISLTNWFRDYVFLPVSYKATEKLSQHGILSLRSNMLIYIVGMIVTWFLTGLWHGANYTFILWGMIHGMFLILYQLQRKPRQILLAKLKIRNDNILVLFIDRLLMLMIILLAWIFFRSNSISQGLEFVGRILTRSFFAFPQIFSAPKIILVFTFLIIEWLQRDKQHALQFSDDKISSVYKWPLYYLIFALIFFYFKDANQQFIYFQF